LLGAGIGSFVPVIGTVVGGVVGSGVGAILGAIGGERIAKGFYAAGEGISNAGTFLFDKTKEIGKSIVEGIKNIFGSIVGGAKQLISGIVDFGKDILNSKIVKMLTKNPLITIAGVITNMIGGFISTIEDLVNKIKESKLVKWMAKKFGFDFGEVSEGEIDNKEQDKNIPANNKELAKSETEKNVLKQVKDAGAVIDATRPVIIVPALADGAVIMKQRKIVVAEAEPEVIIPLSKLDDVYKEFNSNKQPAPVNASATQPQQIQQMNENVDNNKLDKFQDFLTSTLVPMLSKGIASEINKNKSGMTGTDVAVGVY